MPIGGPIFGLFSAGGASPVENYVITIGLNTPSGGSIKHIIGRGLVPEITKVPRYVWTFNTRGRTWEFTDTRLRTWTLLTRTYTWPLDEDDNRG